MAVAALMMVASAFAQAGAQTHPMPKGGAAGEGRGGGQRGNRMLDMDKQILEGLKLSKDQTTKVAALKAKTGEKMKAMRAKMGPPPGARPGGMGGPGGPGGPGAGGPGGPGGPRPDMTKMRAAMQEIRKYYHAGLAKILTKAQLTSYDTQMKAEMDKMRARFGGGRGPGGEGPRGGGPRGGGQ